MIHLHVVVSLDLRAADGHDIRSVLVSPDGRTLLVYLASLVEVRTELPADELVVVRVSSPSAAGHARGRDERVACWKCRDYVGKQPNSAFPLCSESHRSAQAISRELRPAMIYLRTLGSLDLRAADGHQIRSVLVRPKRLALLVYLAVATPRGFHRRDKLLSLFWPEHDESHARNALSQSLYVLRRRLGEGVGESRGR